MCSTPGGSLSPAANPWEQGSLRFGSASIGGLSSPATALGITEGKAWKSSQRRDVLLCSPAGRVLGLHLQLCGGGAALCSAQSGWVPAQPLLGLHHAGQAHLHPRVLPDEASNDGLHQCGKAGFTVGLILLAFKMLPGFGVDVRSWGKAFLCLSVADANA